MKTNTPKNFVIQLGSLITLYVSLTALLILVFGIINLKFPDELEYYGTAENVRESMRMAIAMLIVFFPTFLVLTRLSNQNRRREDAGEYTVLAKWLVYLSLLIGTGVVLGDLVTVIIYFLNGEITTRFILKALAIAVVVGGALTYYILDTRGYFKKREQQSIQFGIGAGILVVIALVYGFMNIETPTEVREMKLDDQQVSDLQDMQWRVEEYYRVEKALPGDISVLYEGAIPPQAPSDRAPYQYNIIDETSYELCANFVHDSQTAGNYRSIASPLTKDNYNWDHGTGSKCFKRVVVEESIPPFIE